MIPFLDYLSPKTYVLENVLHFSIIFNAFYILVLYEKETSRTLSATQVLFLDNY